MPAGDIRDGFAFGDPPATPRLAVELRHDRIGAHLEDVGLYYWSVAALKGGYVSNATRTPPFAVQHGEHAVLTIDAGDESTDAFVIGRSDRNGTFDEMGVRAQIPRNPRGATVWLDRFTGSVTDRWEGLSNAAIVADVRQIILDAMDLVEQSDEEAPLITALNAIDGRARPKADDVRSLPDAERVLLRAKQLGSYGVARMRLVTVTLAPAPRFMIEAHTRFDKAEALAYLRAILGAAPDQANFTELPGTRVFTYGGSFAAEIAFGTYSLDPPDASW